MLNLNGPKDVEFCDGLSRRDFMKVGGLGVMGLSMAELLAAQARSGTPRDMSCIVLFLVGGPSHIDTWDPKPEAPSQIRGPFCSMHTNVPGIDICEHLPYMAQMTDRFAIVRSVFHKEAPIHETGHQLMQTGYLFRGGTEYPNMGSVIASLRGPASELPPYAVVPKPIGNTGVSVPHGQSAGILGAAFEPMYLNMDPACPDYSVSQLSPAQCVDPARLRSRSELVSAVDSAQRSFDATRGAATIGAAEEQALSQVFSPEAKAAFDISVEHEQVRERYGRNTFGQSCLLARRLVERGVRLVTVNMFDTVFNATTWDCHANGGSLAVTLDDYKNTLCPMLDLAYTALLEDLYQRGLLDTTLVIAMGEFGRTYKLNSRGGRDHWPGVWSVLFAGGGVRGGQVIGSSDKHGAEPKDRPVHAAEIAATVYQAFGIDLATPLPGPHDRQVPVAQAKSITELFA
jgi:uncharacterized protein (DUF1501 family)